MQQWASQAPLLHGPQHQQGSDSSTGSLTREQVLQEVQRQVAKEMQSFSQQRSLLEAENQRLRSALEHAVRDRPAQVMDRHEGREQGNPLGSQGNVASAFVEGRGDNPPGLCPQNPSRLGDPLGRQPDPNERGGDPSLRAGGSGDVQRGLGQVRSLGYEPRGDPLENARGSLLSEGDPHKASGGQGLQPPSAAEHVRRNARASGSQQQEVPRPSDPLGLLVQGMTQLQNVVSESLMSRAKEPEVVKPGLSELPKLAELSEKLSHRCGGLAPWTSKPYG